MQELGEDAIGAAGALETYTRIWIPPKAFQEEAPYLVVVVHMKAGARITGRLIGDQAADLPLGATLRLVKRERDVWWFQAGVQ